MSESPRLTIEFVEKDAIFEDYFGYSSGQTTEADDDEVNRRVEHVLLESNVPEQTLTWAFEQPDTVFEVIALCIQANTQSRLFLISALLLPPHVESHDFREETEYVHELKQKVFESMPAWEEHGCSAFYKSFVDFFQLKLLPKSTALGDIDTYIHFPHSRDTAISVQFVSSSMMVGIKENFLELISYVEQVFPVIVAMLYEMFEKTQPQREIRILAENRLDRN